MSLGTLFHLGTPAEAVAERLALYEICRRERASKIQEASRIFSQPQAYQKKKGFNREFYPFARAGPTLPLRSPAH